MSCQAALRAAFCSFACVLAMSGAVQAQGAGSSSAPAPIPARRALVLCAEPGKASVWFRRATMANGQPSADQLVGFSVDMLTAAFQKMGQPMKIRGDLPWTRCLAQVQSGEVDFAFGAYYSDERARTLAYSKPYKTLTPQIFYNTRHPIQVRTIADLKRYKGCGLHGASYEHYGLGEHDLERGVTHIISLVAKLKAERCDYFPEELETFQASPTDLALHLRDPALRHIGIEGATPPSRHLVAAKGSAAAALLPAFDAQVAAMVKSGEFMQLWRKNAGDLPF